jgi:hypothetical protein
MSTVSDAALAYLNQDKAMGCLTDQEYWEAVAALHAELTAGNDGISALRVAWCHVKLMRHSKTYQPRATRCVESDQ